MVVESILVPGRLIAMHEHRNDEIVSWVPAGVMRHDDRQTGALVVDCDHLMVMNAGHSFWHSEETWATDPPLRMLQILVRPREPDLKPHIQFGRLPTPALNSWRHLVSDEGGGAPFFVRNRIDIFDLRVTRNAELDFPASGGRSLYFYVYSGLIEAEGQMFDEGEQGLIVEPGGLRLRARADSVIVAFLVDLAAPLTRQGTVGDHPRIPRPFLGRPLLRLLALKQKLRILNKSAKHYP